MHFCLFLPFCLLIISSLQCVYPPKNTFLGYTSKRGGCTLSFWLDFQYVIPIKTAKVHPPLAKLSRKIFFVCFRSASPSLLIRFKSVVSPFHSMGAEWELHGSHMGLTTDSLQTHFMVLLIFFREFILPIRIGIGEEMGVVEVAVACYLWTEEGRTVEKLVFIR